MCLSGTVLRPSGFGLIRSISISVLTFFFFLSFVLSPPLLPSLPLSRCSHPTTGNKTLNAGSLAFIPTTLHSSCTLTGYLAPDCYFFMDFLRRDDKNPTVDLHPGQMALYLVRHLLFTHEGEASVFARWNNKGAQENIHQSTIPRVHQEPRTSLPAIRLTLSLTTTNNTVSFPVSIDQ